MSELSQAMDILQDSVLNKSKSEARRLILDLSDHEDMPVIDLARAKAWISKAKVAHSATMKLLPGRCAARMQNGKEGLEGEVQYPKFVSPVPVLFSQPITILTYASGILVLERSLKRVLGCLRFLSPARPLNGLALCAKLQTIGSIHVRASLSQGAFPAHLLQSSDVFIGKKDGDIDPRMPGRIHELRYRQFWSRDLKASSMHLSLLKEGYKLPLIGLPKPSRVPNNKSAIIRDNFQFVCDSIANHLKVGAIREVVDPPYLIMPLQVVSPVGRKKRLITDPSRQLNPFLAKKSVQLDHLPSIFGSIKQDHWFGVMDLSSGYYHIKVNESHQKYLGFSWKGTDSIIRFYVWQITFLGLSPLVREFTKLQKRIIAYLRLKGIPCFIYIDDLIVFGQSHDECAFHMSQARHAWANAGWIEKISKAKGPTQRGVFLGLELDTSQLKVFVPQQKKDLISAMCFNLTLRSSWPVRVLAQVYGTCLANLLATGPQLLLLTRNGLKAIASAVSWFGAPGLTLGSSWWTISAEPLIGMILESTKCLFNICKSYALELSISTCLLPILTFEHRTLPSDLALFRDAFSHPWSDLGFCFAHPPISEISSTIYKIINDRASGVLILPFWRTMSSWLIVCADEIHFNNVFTRGTAFHPYYRKGINVISPTFSRFTPFATLALEFDGNTSALLRSRLHQDACSIGGCDSCTSFF
eukprot:TCALIF_10146-PA protein Name:"Similar to ORF V Enzymatic polyprotein (Cestrum yellow leaf curling virus)" AED:0.27 eAED:0.43 QI:0/0/0/0.66/0.4/0.16/6/0/698